MNVFNPKSIPIVVSFIGTDFFKGSSISTITEAKYLPEGFFEMVIVPCLPAGNFLCILQYVEEPEMIVC